MSTLYLLNYNNYYNRIVKSTTLANYKSQALYTLKDVNFKPMDSCYTDQIVNISESVNPDYVVITETANNVETIASRWFILESSRVRGNQYKLRLRRDVFVDYNDIVKAATLYCEKGYVSDDDPLIFNSEGNTYNQIKTSEKLLKDETGSAWLVGYCDYSLMDIKDQDDEIKLTLYDYAPQWSRAFGSLADAMEDDDFDGSCTTSSIQKHIANVEDVSYTYGMGQRNGNNDPTYYNVVTNISGGSTSIREEYTGCLCDNMSLMLTGIGLNLPDIAEFNEPVEIDKSADNAMYQRLYSANGTVIRTGSGDPGDEYEYYKLHVVRNYGLFDEAAALGSASEGFIENLLYITSEQFNQHVQYYPNDIRIRYTAVEYYAAWEQIEVNRPVAIKDNIPLSLTSPYYMFCIPYHPVKFNDENGTLRTSNPNYTLQFARQLIRTAGTHVFDVQLLPYFPDRYFTNAGVILLDEVDSKSVTWIKDANNVAVSFVYWGAPQNFSFDMSESIAKYPSKKIDNETRFCRLSAPNYSSFYDFSIAKNNGVDGFRIYCTYRPYQPHIQVMPSWGGVYGQNFADARGLICGGDYSIDIVNDQWTEYTIMNKNYQLIFDRQIQSMDLQHDVQQMNDIFGAIGGMFSGAANGAMMGAGGGAGGMIAGGIVGGLTSAIGGGLDIYNNQRLRTDQRSAAFDMFNYNLGNIKARPATLTKLSALAGNNKIWPFYEIYEATSQEVSRLRYQIEYSSMTVNAIGTVYEFMSGAATFIRGRLIRIIGLEHDAEMSQLVADELARGIYFDDRIT